MKVKMPGIFGKIFLYTLSFLIAIIGLTAILFARQFEVIFEEGGKQVVAENIRPLLELVKNKPASEIIAIANEFQQQNIYMQFHINDSKGNILYKSPAPNLKPGSDERRQDIPYTQRPDISYGTDQDGSAYMAFPLSDGMTLYVFRYMSEPALNKSILVKIVIALLIMLFISILVSYLFARGITSPILKLAKDTEKMSALEDVAVPEDRNDEIGLLARNVYKMYSSLKAEIEHQKEIEENQRYFFSAASHELKTPVASSMVLLQGMLDNIGDYKDHPKYLRKCIDKMSAQNRIISEMLEIVRLSDGKTSIVFESVDIRAIVESILEAHHALVNTKSLEVILDLPDTLMCRTDRSMLHRALFNVIMNAVQYTDEKEKIRIWNEEGKNDGIRIYILNTGTHIEDEILKRMFDPFFRADKARSRDQGSSGLGLTIVRKSLELIHAGCSIENTSEGVLFKMEIPGLD